MQDYKHRISSEVFLNEAKRIVEEATKQKIVLRIMGALGIRLHSLELSDFHKNLTRLGTGAAEFTDIDIMSEEKYRSRMKTFFESIDYVPDKTYYVIHVWSLRHIYHKLNEKISVDVFFDKLDMCHTIDLRNRLEVDYPTIPLADLLLEKLQIVNINEKDIKDVIVLLKAHNVGDSDEETINADYIAKLLSKDWGFWYTVMMNLNKVRSFARRYANEGLIKEDYLQDIHSKIDQIVQFIENTPKTLAWKMRAKIGTKKKWYRDVEEIK
jgi:hypothetical protein